MFSWLSLIIITPLLLLSLTLFFFSNIFIILKNFSRIRADYFLDKESLFKQLRFFFLRQEKQNSLSFICAIIFGILGLAAGIIGSLSGALIGWILPGIFIKVYRKQYLAKLNKQLVSTLNLLESSLSAGESFSQAIGSLQGVVPPPMADELIIINRQLRLGISMEDALNDFSKRVPLDDIHLTVRAMIISMHTGMNIVTAIDQIAEMIRQRNAVQGKIDALTIQGKAQGVVVGLLPLFLGAFLYWRDPQSMGLLFTTLFGRLIITVMVLMEVAAFFVIRKIVTINI